MPTQTTQKNSGEKTRKVEWKRVKLGEVCDVIGGGTPSKSKEEYFNGDIGWITPKDLSGYNSKYISHGALNISELGLKKSSARLLPKGTVLFSSRAPIGYVAIASNNICTNQGFKSLICNKDSFFNEYAYYLLKFKKDEIEQHASGSTFKEISGGVLKNFQVEIPPLSEQKKIAEVLSAYDDLIEVNQKKIKTLETLAQTLYKEWFIKPVKDGLPDGWEETALGNLCDLKKDKFIKKDHENLPLVDMARINSKSLSITNTGNSKELSTSRIIFQNGDILFGSIRCYLHKVALAPFNGVTNVSVFVVRPKEEYLKSFLYCHLFDADTLRWADQNSSGTKMPVIKWEVFKNKKIILPQKEKLSEFNNLVGDFFEQIKILSIENQNLQKTRDILIPQLVGGKVEVR